MTRYPTLDEEVEMFCEDCGETFTVVGHVVEDYSPWGVDHYLETSDGKLPTCPNGDDHDVSIGE